MERLGRRMADGRDFHRLIVEQLLFVQVGGGHWEIVR